MNELRGQRQMPTSLNQLKTTLAFRIYKVAPLDLVSSHELTMNWAETSEHVDQTRSLTAGAGHLLLEVPRIYGSWMVSPLLVVESTFPPPSRASSPKVNHPESSFKHPLKVLKIPGP